MRITLTEEEIGIVAELAGQPLPDGVEEVAYTVNQNLTVEKNKSGVTIMRGRPSSSNGVYAVGAK